MTCSQKSAIALAAAALMLAAIGGCEKSAAEMRGDPSNLTAGDTGLQSKDLIEMTDKMAPDLLKIPEIVANPNKVVIVMTGIENQTGNPTEPMNIYVARLRVLLNENARDRLAFVERRATTESLQAQEGGGGGDVFEEGSRTGAPGGSGRLVPQYALKGVFMSLDRARSNYYLCTFQLTSIKTGEIVWEGHYEVKTLD
jgi:PBP1b-binding outer membrane lipoprotein LpoB